MCRQCGANFVPGTTRAPAVGLTPREPRPRSEMSLVASATALLKPFDGLWKSTRPNVIECLDCHRKQEVSTAASSTICPQCSAHIDLQDYKIATSFSRTIRTTGEVYVTSKGDLNSTNVHCRVALVQGKMRGNLHCAETARFDLIGRIPGRISAREVMVEKRAEVQFFRRVKVQNIEIRGQMAGEIIAEGMVTIRKHGVLEGNVTARSINVEKGGMFVGQLIIGKADLQQAELLPNESSQKASDSSSAPLGSPLPSV